MANPGDTVRLHSRNGGRHSIYEANAWPQMVSAGFLDGDGVLPSDSGDMNILVGGSGTKPDIVIAENPAGHHIMLDLVNQQRLLLTAPASNSRIASVIAYTDDLSLVSTDTDSTGSPSSCGLIIVYGASSASPVAPSDSDIRTAITSDGATGSQACYSVLANVTISATTTVITGTLISLNQSMLVTPLAANSVTADKIDLESLDSGWIQLNTIIKYRKIGAIVFVYGESSDDQPISGGGYTTVGTLPAGARPASKMYFAWTGVGQNTTGQSAAIGDDGKIELYLPSGVFTGYWAFETSFPTEVS